MTREASNGNLLIILAALVFAEVIGVEQAEAIAGLFNAPKSYDNPVPLNVEAAYGLLIDRYMELDDDEAICEHVAAARAEHEHEHVHPVDAFDSVKASIPTNRGRKRRVRNNLRRWLLENS